jgi:hypothetical protein
MEIPKNQTTEKELFGDLEDKEFLGKVEEIINDPEKAQKILRLAYNWMKQKQAAESIDNKEYF